MQSVEVSPNEPGMKPRKASVALHCISPVVASCSSAVAPETPSVCAPIIDHFEYHTSSPDICGVKAKNTNARAVSAGLKIFIPVPPNTSLPNITAKATPKATIHSGVLTGIIIGINRPVTR